jgi:LPXTG-motif cell wall-anchored protein
MKPGVYSFTSMVGPENGPPTAISVGSFSGGGYKPRPGQEDPPKPPVQTSIKNPWVQVKFNQGVSQPFQVSSLTDLGKDPSVNNATRVLLDGEIPAWGEWSKTDSGEALFVITETQLLPGVKPPAQEPLPGYNVKLVSSTGKPPSSGESTDVFLIVAAAAAGLLALGVIGVFVVKRRKSNDEAPTASIDANS